MEALRLMIFNLLSLQGQVWNTVVNRERQRRENEMRTGVAWDDPEVHVDKAVDVPEELRSSLTVFLLDGAGVYAHADDVAVGEEFAGEDGDAASEAESTDDQSDTFTADQADRSSGATEAEFFEQKRIDVDRVARPETLSAKSIIAFQPVVAKLFLIKTLTSGTRATSSAKQIFKCRKRTKSSPRMEKSGNGCWKGKTRSSRPHSCTHRR